MNINNFNFWYMLFMNSLNIYDVNIVNRRIKDNFLSQFGLHVTSFPQKLHIIVEGKENLFLIPLNVIGS